MDGLDETANPPYLVPTHLGEGQSIGPIPVRTFYVVLASALLLGAPVATLGRRELGDVGLWLGLLPIVLATPFALPWLDPPAEHGALRLLQHIGRRLSRIPLRRLPPRREMLAADGLLAFLRVWGQYRRTTALGLAEQQDLARLQVADSVVYVPIGRRLEPRAIYRVPTINLDTASAETDEARGPDGVRSSTVYRTPFRS